MKSSNLLIVLIFFMTLPVLSQEIQTNAPEDTAYKRVITERTEKIVATLGIDDTSKHARVRKILVQQYFSLSTIHDTREARVKAAREQTNLDKEIINKQVEAIKNEAIASLYKLHFAYLAKLTAELTSEQVDMVKDGMTYGVLSRTNDGYLNLLPQLTEEQKRFILSNLIEARELAMDQGSSEEKHKVFGKYKGRINNYLSKEGYDLKKAEAELKERQKSKSIN